MILLLASIPAKASRYDNIRIISSDEAGLVFELNLDDPAEYANPIADGQGIALFIPILIAVPPNHEAFISEISGSEPFSWICPGGLPIRSPSKNLAAITGTSVVRGRRLAALEIYPYYQGILYGKIKTAIQFRQTGGAVTPFHVRTEGKIFDAVFGYSVLNYDHAKSWPLEESGPIAAKAQESVFDLADEWYKIEIGTGGFIRITGQNLVTAGMVLNNIASDSIHLFYGGGLPVPVDNSEDRPVLREVAITVNDNGDGIFNVTDNLIFYAEAADRWIYPSDSLPYFFENHYTNTNCYWLAVSGSFGQTGKRIQSIDAAPDEVADTVMERGWFYTRVGENKLLYRDNSSHIYDYFNWYWSDTTSKTFSIYMPNAVTAESSQVRIRARVNGINVSVNGSAATLLSSQSLVYVYRTYQLFGGLNRFVVTMSPNYDAPPYMGFCEVAYQGYLLPQSSLLDFYISPFEGRGEFVVTDQFGGETPRIYDLSDVYEPVLLVNASLGTDIIFQDDLSGGSGKRYYICAPSKMTGSATISKVTPMGDIASADMYIIVPEEFIGDLGDFEQYRETKSNISVALVALEDIINRYSFGLYDPGAIRDFLKNSYDNPNGAVPSAVLLVGDGSYDYENNLLTPTRNYIPPYIHELDATSSDDNYVYFGDYGLLDSDSTYCDTCSDRGYDMIIARWPVSGAAQIYTIVDKIKNYESMDNLGDWRSFVTLVADDEYDDGDYEGLTHTRQTEILQESHLPRAFRRNKIYAWEYPFNSDKDKPEVNRQIVRSINDGTLLINYVGHGNPDTWAHEHILNRSTDLQKLTNLNRLTFVYIASCAIGFFDNPSREGMAEELLRLASGGAVAAVSATRLVYSGENSGLNRQVFDILFDNDDLSICQVLYAAKLIRQYSNGYIQEKINDRKYTFFGDPFVRLGIPARGINFTEYPGTLVALDTHLVIGEVVDEVSEVPVDFNGTVHIAVYDSEILRLYRGVNNSGVVVDSLSYAKNGPILFQGTAEVVNGNFSFEFISPLDIGYGGSGACIYAYAESPGSDAFGLADSIEVSSTIVSTEDSDGPEIRYSFSDRENFVSGDRIASGSILNIALTDGSGINLTGGTGHGIDLTIDGDTENIIGLTDLFEYNSGSFTSGEIRYYPGSLPVGRHRFKIKAWDNANNSSVVEFDAELVETGKMQVSEVMNYPNPMTDKTMFSFALTADARLVSLEIFTLSGKKIKYFEENSVPDDYYEFYEWDGRDDDGDRVAAGVYIYKVTAFSMDSEEVVESFGKVVVLN
nr:type IX secretion system sortase PorU [candidate division Zixibacteria bacterium]